ncbi:ComEC family competence protein [Flaviaesturariibacter flavus]|uniref:ComEC family competence protein n=1 Tax=Flaviaesturariibacter flavus TaxID=2502780 RepID=A0A4R1BAS4_9BACT|nr:ComEC/Rec2 family competence protein [Flaviaesturariibacter flavus]TCJ14053.1 ComEC family competence protein [Flaviaesturariibacter flavus]
MRTPIPPWRKTPVLRLLLPFAAGIALHDLLAATPTLFPALAALALLFLLPLLLSEKMRFRWRALPGAGTQLLLLVAGALWLQARDVRRAPGWIGNYPSASRTRVVLTAEPSEKAASWKLEGQLLSVATNNGWQPASGGVLLYLRKDSGSMPPRYGQELLIDAPLAPVRGSGNPAAFDYTGWALRQGTTHSAFLGKTDYHILPGWRGSRFQSALLQARAWTIGVLRRYLPGGGAGMAEALLIGYKDDLDKELVRSYSRTGVVHIIAISGMHLALVYGLLIGLTAPLRAQRLQWLRMTLVLAGLWSFSFLAGGGPSVLRAAVMFSFLAFGSLIGRKGNAMNTLLLGALVLLLINPFWLWDAGFQLSCTAVAGILLFYRPIYALYTPHNRLLDALWKGSAVTLAAQVLTTPISLYHFHQFPLLFLAANLLAVPLSGLLVYALLVLLGFSFWPGAATLIGKGADALIALLNQYIAAVERSPVAVWEGISVSPLQVLLLYALIAALAWGPLRLQAPAWRTAFACGALFLCLRAYSFWQAGRQARFLVYNIPRHVAMEVHDGRQVAFRGDASVLAGPLREQHLGPAHVAYRLREEATTLPSAFRFGNRSVVVFEEGREALPASGADVLVVSGKPRMFLPALLQEGRVRQLVLDATVPKRSAARWKADCAQAGVPCHDVREAGAFVLDL